MNNIAILVSGSGEAALRIIKLFNEGNRVRTVLVIADDSAIRVLEEIEDKDITLLHIPDKDLESRKEELDTLLRENDIRLLVLDGYRQAVADSTLAAAGGKMIRVSSVQEAPREVIAELEADLRRPKETVVKVEEKTNPTPEEEWASSLKINFQPPKIQQTPPPIPGSDEMPQINPLENQGNSSDTENREIKFERPYEGSVYSRYDNSYRNNWNQGEPMPSTYLIWSILVTVFCCFIPGIIAIIFSSQVSSRYYAGDIEGAKRSSRTAEIWIIVSVVLGVLAATLWLPFMMIGG